MSAIDTETVAVEETEGQDAVAIRRNVLLSGLVGALAALLGLAFLSRSSGFLDRPLGLLLLVLAALHLVALGSLRVPVLVADEQGIRLRLGLAWRGLPWSSIRQVVIEHADSPLREGRLVIVPRDPATTAGLDALATAHVRWNRFWYDAPLAVPLGMTTTLDGPDLAADLRALADGRVDIADLRGKELATLAVVPARPRPITAPAAEDGDVALRLPADEMVAVDDVDDELPPPPEDDLTEALAESLPEPPRLPEPVAPLRDLRPTVRAEVRLDRHEDKDEDKDEDKHESVAPAVPDQRQPGEIAAMLAGAEVIPLEPYVAEDAVTPALPEPIIGAKIAHAREMLDMSIEELSDRTRIRPHVLEAMELDDFGPCGGDVYARGHLQSVARILGLTLEPLMAVYEERYAQGPINARRVFEAELSTGASGGMRATFGGPRWSLLISAVLCLTMVWGLARLFAGDPEQLSAAPGAGEVAVQSANQEPITSPLMRTTPMTVKAAFAPAHVVVKDRTGKILWSGDLAIGTQRKVVGLAPFRVSADNAGGVTVTVRGKLLGPVGTAGEAGAKKFG